MMDDYRITIRRACTLVLLLRSMWYYQAQAWDEQAIRRRMREIAMTRVRYGLDRIHILLRREGWRDSRNRVYRLYKLEGLNLRSKRPRRSRSCSHRLDRIALSTGRRALLISAGAWILFAINSPTDEDLGL